MKKFKKLSALFLSVLLLLSCMTITAYAAQSAAQDGLSAVIETDKESYEANEPILVTVTVTNTNSFAMKNVSIESILPASLTAQDGTLKSDTVDLESGEELTLTFTAVLEKEVPPVTEPGTSEPDTSEPDTSEPDTTEPTVTDPSQTEPSETEPTVTEPTVTNPSTQPTTENPTAAGEVTTTEEQTTLTPETTTAVNAADHANGTSPITGAPAVALKVLLVVVMVAAVAFAVVMLTRKNGKKATKILSVVLSVVICGSSLVTTGMIAKAEENTRSFSVDKIITVDGENYIVSASVKYDKADIETGIEIERFMPLEFMYYPINETTTMSFYAFVSNPQNVTLDSVKVTDTDDNLIGYLYDNGKSPDEVANDGIYSGNLELYSEIDETFTLLAHAGNAVKAKDIFFVAPLTGHEMDILNKVSDDLLDIEQKYPDDKDKMFDAVEAYLKESSDVKSYNRTEESITYITTDGMHGVVFEPTEEDTLGGTTKDDAVTPNLNKDITSMQYATHSNRKIAVIKPWDPFDSRFNTHLEEMAQKFSDKYNDSVDTFYGVDTYEAMKNLSDYDMILINTHGKLYNNDSVISCFAGPESAESVVYDLKQYMIDFCKTETKLDGFTEKKGTIWLTPTWFSHYYDSYNGYQELQNCFIYLGACKSLDNSVLANNFIRLGADCVIGYTGTVTNVYEEEMGDALLNAILNGDSVAEFFDNKVIINDSSDPKHKETHMARIGNYSHVDNNNPTPDDNFAGGNGSINNPYQIATARQLDAVRNHLDSNFVLINDIDLSEYSNWVPIGGYKNVEEGDGLRGSFDGQGHTISNLKMDYVNISNEDDTSDYYLGLFSDTTLSPEIKNFNLENVQINVIGSEPVRIGAVSAMASVVSNCNVSGNIKLSGNCSGSYVGGIAFSASRIVNSSSDIDISALLNGASATYLGGIIAYAKNSATISNCTNCGNIYGNISEIGSHDFPDIYCAGIATQAGSRTQLLNCKNYGSIESSSDDHAYAAGISADADRINHTNCINYGRISARSYKTAAYAGGIVARCTGWNDQEHNTITKCVNFGDLTAIAIDENRLVSAICGGIIADGMYVDISQCYNLGMEFNATARQGSEELEPTMGRIAGSLNGPCFVKDSYSIDSTLMNGLPATENVGTDQKNGGSMTKAEIEKAVTDLGFELPA